MTTQAPTPFPYEDPEHQLPTRPTVRRPVFHGDDDYYDSVDPTPPPYKTGDPIARWLIAATLTLFVVFLMAGVTRTPNSGRIMLACILTGIPVCAAGWAAYAIRDRKAKAASDE